MDCKTLRMLIRCARPSATADVRIPANLKLYGVLLCEQRWMVKMTAVLPKWVTLPFEIGRGPKIAEQLNEERGNIGKKTKKDECQRRSLEAK